MARIIPRQKTGKWSMAPHRSPCARLPRGILLTKRQSDKAAMALPKILFLAPFENQCKPKKRKADWRHKHSLVRRQSSQHCSLRGLSPRPMAHKTIALTTELKEPCSGAQLWSASYTGKKTGKWSMAPHRNRCAQLPRPWDTFNKATKRQSGPWLFQEFYF